MPNAPAPRDPSEGELWQAWGGPLDGETLTMLPGQYEIMVYRDRATGSVVAWKHGIDKPKIGEHEYLGEYRWTDPSRLGWRPRGASRHA